MDYFPRIIDAQLQHLLERCPAVVIDGARGIGKTMTGSEHAATVYDMDDPETREDMAGNHRLMLSAPKPIFIDEWLRYPQSMNLVKMVVDKDRTPGQFIMASTPTTSRQRGIHSGALRVADLFMRPMSLAERRICAPTVSLGQLLDGGRDDTAGTSAVTKADYLKQVIRSGFPALHYETDDPVAADAYLEGYLSRLPAVDMKVAAGRRQRFPAGPVRQWLAAYAQETSRITSFATMRDNAHAGDGETPAEQTAAKYRDLIAELGVIEPLPPWKCLLPLTPPPIKKHMHHLVDPALAAHLLDVKSIPDLLTSDASGVGPAADIGSQLFQSLVTQSVRVYAEACGAKVRWLRTKKDGRGGEREIDLVVVRNDGRIVAIEVKFGQTIGSRAFRNLRWLRGQIGSHWIDGVVINAGRNAGRTEDGIAVVPAALLGP